MKKLALILSALFLLSGLASCSGSSGTPAPKLDLTEVEDAYYDLMCDKLIECESETFMMLLLQDTAGCVDFLKDNYQAEHGGIDDMIAAVTAGTTSYDGAAAYDCLEQQDAQSCTEFGKNEPEICQEVFTGSLATGEACELGSECISNYCDTSTACPGECKTTKQEGQSCEDDAMCGFGLKCVKETCRAWVAPLGDGDECDPGDNDWCDIGLFCNEQSEECAPRVAVGQTCQGEGDAECVYGALCLDDGLDNLSCVELTLVDTADEVCSNITGHMCSMTAGLSCRIDNFATRSGTCVSMPQLGDTCFESGATPAMTQCDFIAKLYCDVPPDYQSDGTCRPLKADGQPCAEGQCLGVCNSNEICETLSDTMCQ